MVFLNTRIYDAYEQLPKANKHDTKAEISTEKSTIAFLLMRSTITFFSCSPHFAREPIDFSYPAIKQRFELNDD